MRRVSTHGLCQTHTQSHSFGAFHTYGKQEVHHTDLWGEGDKGNLIWLFHRSLSCRYSIWTLKMLHFSKNQTSTSHAPKLSKTSKNLLPFWFPCLSHPSRSTLRFPSSLWMAFPGLQHTQEIESVIVYVSAESMTTVFSMLLSAHISLLFQQESRTEELTVGFVSLQTALGPKKGQGVGLVLQELTWTQLIMKN